MEAQLNTNLVEGLENEERFFVLENALRVLWNMVPDSKESDFTKISKDIWTASNHHQPVELLGGHCIGSFLLNNNSVIDNIEKNAQDRTKKTLYGELGLPNIVKNELSKYM